MAGSPDVPNGSPAAAAVEARLVELEVRFTEQQELLSELSGVLYAQQRVIEGLEMQVGHLRKKLEAEPGMVDAKADEKPPHY